MKKIYLVELSDIYSSSTDWETLGTFSTQEEAIEFAKIKSQNLPYYNTINVYEADKDSVKNNDHTTWKTIFSSTGDNFLKTKGILGQTKQQRMSVGEELLKGVIGLSDEEYNELQESAIKKTNSQIKGALLGLACGDYLGMPFEFNDTREINDYLTTHKLGSKNSTRFGVAKQGCYTDDTAMALCLAKSLIEKGFDTLDQFRKYQMWANQGYMSADPKTGGFGIGQHTLNILLNQKETEIPTVIGNEDRSGGNGALMRCLPIGLVYKDSLEDIINKSILSALVTHNNKMAAFTCVVYNVLIAYILKGLPKETLIKRLLQEDLIKDIPEELLSLLKDYASGKALLQKDLPNSGYTFDTLNIALFSFLTTNDFSSAIENSIKCGGDTDTQGAVTGGLAGAYYGLEGIPKAWIKVLMNKEMIMEIAEELIKIA